MMAAVRVVDQDAQEAHDYGTPGAVERLRKRFDGFAALPHAVGERTRGPADCEHAWRRARLVSEELVPRRRLVAQIGRHRVERHLALVHELERGDVAAARGRVEERLEEPRRAREAERERQRRRRR